MGRCSSLNGSRSVIATALIYGTGQGPQIQFPSNPTITPLGGGFSSPVGVGRGRQRQRLCRRLRAYSAVKEMPAGCASSSCVTTLGGGFSYPYGVPWTGRQRLCRRYRQQRGEGDAPWLRFLQLRNHAGRRLQPVRRRCGGRERQRLCRRYRTTSAVKEMPPGCAPPVASPRWAAASAHPRGVAVDGSGNVYVADQANNAVKEMPPGCASSSCVTTLGGGFSQPYGVAVDGSGNVYVADSGNSGEGDAPGLRFLQLRHDAGRRLRRSHWRGGGLGAATSMSPIAITTR